MTAPSFPAPGLVAELMAMVGQAETAFRSRWRLATLARLDPELHGLLCEQIDLYQRSLVTGSDDEARDQAGAMVRGWRAAVAALESPLQADDAYLTGWDENTNTIVVIAECSGSGARAHVEKGQKIVVVTPDEVAKIVAGLNIVMQAKGLFPDAEVVRFVGAASEAETIAGDEALRNEAELAADASRGDLRSRMAQVAAGASHSSAGPA